MLAYIKGTLEDIAGNDIIIENQGIGYLVSSSLNSIRQLPQIGVEIKLFTKLIPREDQICLYGFLSKDELATFELLVSVSGIGPKGASVILGAMTVRDIHFAIAGSDAKAFAACPGIGKKTAERIIVDLKDKIDIVSSYENKLNNSENMSSNNNLSVKEEVLEALVALGYSPSNAAKALDKMTITDSVTTEQLLSDTLKQMSFI